MIKLLMHAIKTKKVFCLFCKYRVPFIEAFTLVKRTSDKPNDDGEDVCSETFQYYYDSVGVMKLKTYGKIEYCENCDQVIHDDRQIIYKKCNERNRNNDCKAFKPRFLYKIFLGGLANAKRTKDSRRNSSGDKATGQG